MTRVTAGWALALTILVVLGPGCPESSSSIVPDSRAVRDSQAQDALRSEAAPTGDAEPEPDHWIPPDSGGDTGAKPDSSEPPGPCAFYVAISGSDSNPGSSSKPFRTIQHAASSLQAGQTACVNAGTYNESVTLTKGGASTSSLVTIKGVGSSRPVVAPPAGKNGFTIKASFVLLESLEIKNGSPNNVSVEANANDVRLQGLLVHHAAQEGILVNNAKRFRLTGGEVHDNGVSAEEARAIGVRFIGIVDGALAESTKLYQSSTTHSARGMSFFGTHGTKGITLRLLEVHDHQQHGIFLTPGNEHRDPSISNISVSRCWFHDNGKRVREPKPGDRYYAANLLIQKAKDVRVERSRFNSSRGWGIDCFVCQSALIVNNIFVNIRKAASGVGPGIGVEVNAGQGNRVVHNTFVDLTKGIISTFRGQASVSPGTWPPSWKDSSTLEWHNNLFYKDADIFAASFETYVEGGKTYHYEQNDLHTKNLLEGDPKFVDYAKWNFHLQAGSPAVDSGGDQHVTEDYDGAARPRGKAPDQGAYERAP